MEQANQVEAVWRGMLYQATSSGMTREDIARLTADTCRTIARGTFDALFPQGTFVAPDESGMYSELLGLVGFTEATLEGLTPTNGDEPAA